MSPSRIVVGLSPANLVSHRPQAGTEEVPKAGRIKAAPTLGLLFWSEGWDDWCTVIVKAVLKRGESDLLSAEMVFATPAQADPFERPVDFVPWKGGVDVLVVGAVELSGPVEKGRGLSGEVVVGGVSTAFDVPADEPIVSPLPLARAQLRGAEGLDAMLGPSNFFDISQTKFHHEEKVSLRCYLSASQGLLRKAVQPGSTVSIKLSQPDGSSAKQLFSADYELPKLTPRILVSPAKPGGAEVRVAVQRSGGQVQLQVDDSGPGLAEADLARLGERFFRVLGSGRDGSGLGWSIVRRIAAAQGATVAVGRSAALGGLSVTVAWPAAAGPAGGTAAA